jgi:sigma-B regulation protein RsbU (phosphoserine phosphatase)
LGALLKAVNRQAYSSSLADRYATLFYGVFDNTKRTLRYVNAGHNPPAVLRGNGSVEWLETSGAPVGMFPDSIYEEKVIELEDGDVVIAFTDGVVEATNQNGDEWGVQGLLKAAVYGAQRSRDASDLVNLIFHSMDDFSQGHQTDDATVAVVRVCLTRLSVMPK